MPNPFRRCVFAEAGSLITGSLICLLSLGAPRAIGQDTAAPLTPIQKQFERVTFAIQAAGFLSDTVSGIEKRDNVPLSIRPSNTVGELFTLRYVAKPLVGFEFNVSNARLDQNYTYTPPPTVGLLAGGAQTGFRELTLGYVAHLRQIHGIDPYLGAGGGTIHFQPTVAGGQGLPFQYRAVYYYDAGLEYTFTDSHFGIRTGFRQLIYLAPDFGENYLTITRRERTSQPTFGFFLRF